LIRADEITERYPGAGSAERKPEMLKRKKLTTKGHEGIEEGLKCDHFTRLTI